MLDGRDIREYDVRELYSLFGIIFQDFGKYAVSVKENIEFGDVSRPENEDDVKKAAHQSNADVFIEKLADGYNTPLMRYFETEGKELSIGQWQKIAVARAFYGDSDILILDEPTASLDAIAEQEIFSQFEELRKGKLTVFVSHRLSSAVTASRIVVISDGTIIEKGTHNELIKKGGVYHDLFLTQAERYIATAQDDADKGAHEKESENKAPEHSFDPFDDSQTPMFGMKPPEGDNGRPPQKRDMPPFDNRNGRMPPPDSRNGQMMPR